MNRSQACDLISQTFTKSFDKSQFRSLSINILNHIDEQKAQAWSSQYVKDAFKPHVQRYERLGTYTSPQKEKLDVLVVHLTADSKLERARTAIRNFVADHLKTRAEKDAALVAFVSPSESTWRFSYVKMEYATIKKGSGAVGVETRLTPARRFSYIVGEGESCHTAQTRFLNLLQDTEADPTLAEIEEAFSVEAVTKEFFTKYAELFEEIYKALDKLVAKDKAVCNEFTGNNISTVDFAKKLMGQIVFLYFLQKKGWLGVAKGEAWGTGPHDFLRRLAKGEYGQYNNFFNDILEPLFFDTLATDRGHEAWCNIFKCRIPFLNGGLFEPLGNYNWRKTKILLPNRLFMNSEPVDEGITGTGVLDIFDRYNFTVNEAEPLEKEVAIDPEMLGKVFEKLIEENRRKKLGAVYTPREIVHYMCQESLVNYLNTAINKENTLIAREDIETFVHLGEQFSFYETAKKSGTIGSGYPTPPESIEKHARLIDEQLSGIRVCDPAVGSGAFPVGMMTEIVRARSALTPYFNDAHERTPYYFKRHAIQNCIYGVDIDPGAVEIAKLRLWLSLVVDEEEVKQIKPLPNLDYKIMQGNSLVEEYEGIKLFDEKFIMPASLDSGSIIHKKIDNLEKEALQLHSIDKLSKNKKKEIEEEIKRLTAAFKKINSPKVGAGPMLFGEFEKASKKAEELRILHTRFFEESRHGEKESLKKQIGLLEWELIEATLREEGKESALKKLDQFKKTDIRPFFLWKLNFSEVFREKGGFDVMIANPPYIKEYVDRKAFDGLHTSPYYQGKMDIWYLFACRSLDMIKSQSGILAFIAQNNWVTSSGASKMRIKVTQDAKLLSLVDFGNYMIFDRGIQTMVMLFQADKQPDQYVFNLRRLLDGEIVFRDILDVLAGRETPKAECLRPLVNRTTYASGATLNFSNSEAEEILSKIAAQSNFTFTENEIAQGIVPNPDVVSAKAFSKIPRAKADRFKLSAGDGVFVIDKGFFKKLHPEEKVFIKPLYEPTDLIKYYMPINRKEIIYLTNKNYKASLPNILSHLEKYREIMEARRENQTGQLDFCHLHWPRDERFFQHGPKILSVRKCEAPTFVYTEKDAYVMMAFNVIKTNRIDLKYLTAILNSKVVAFWLKHKGKMQGSNYQIDKDPLLALPIKTPSEKQQNTIVELVDEILSLMSKSDYTTSETKQQKVCDYCDKIDQLVYTLYDLTPDERKFIEDMGCRKNESSLVNQG